MSGVEQKSDQTLITTEKGKEEKDWHNSTSKDVPKEVKEEVFQVLEEFRKSLENIFSH